MDDIFNKPLCELIDRRTFLKMGGAAGLSAMLAALAIKPSLAETIITDTSIKSDAIDYTPIGAVSPSTGAFTTLKADTDPVDEHGVGDRGFNDTRYLSDIVEDTTPQLGGDLDAQGYYALGLQNIPDLAAKGPGFWFDGVNDRIVAPLVIGAYPLYLESSFTWFEFDSLSSSILSYVDLSYFQYYLTISILNATGELVISRRISLQQDINTGVIIEPYKEYHIITQFIDETSVKIWLNGKLIYSTSTAPSISISNDFDALVIGIRRYAEMTGFHSGSINKATVGNFILTDDEAKAFSSGAPIPFKYIGASQTALTSGTLIAGKQYIIDTFVAGDNFVNVGGTNVTGNAFIATGTTPTTWTNSSSLRQIGCVLQLEQPGIGHNQWLDNSGNELHGAVSGALPTNLPADDVERFRHTVAMTDDTTWTSVVPAGYELEKIIFVNSTANAATLDLGTAATGSQVFLNQVIAASGITTVVINKTFSMSAAQSLFLNDDDGSSSWNSASLTATLLMRRVI